MVPRHGSRFSGRCLRRARFGCSMGFVAGFVGPGASLSLVGLLALGAFVVFWGGRAGRGRMAENDDMTFQPEQMVRLCWQGLTSPREGTLPPCRPRPRRVPRAASGRSPASSPSPSRYAHAHPGRDPRPRRGWKWATATLQPMFRKVEPAVSRLHVLPSSSSATHGRSAALGRRLGGTGTFEEASVSAFSCR